MSIEKDPLLINIFFSLSLTHHVTNGQSHSKWVYSGSHTGVASPVNTHLIVSPTLTSMPLLVPILALHAPTLFVSASVVITQCFTYVHIFLKLEMRKHTHHTQTHMLPSHPPCWRQAAGLGQSPDETEQRAGWKVRRGPSQQAWGRFP